MKAGFGFFFVIFISLSVFSEGKGSERRNILISAGASNCALEIKGDKETLDSDYPPESFLSSNQIVVTGGAFHTLEDILQNLHLDRRLEGFRGKSVLSVGEGYSDLLPFLLSKGISASAADSAYPQRNQSLGQYETGLPTLPARTQVQNRPAPILENISRRQKEELLQFVKKYRDRLIHASTPRLPLADASFDIVLSHRLLNNVVEIEEVLNFLREWIRVARFQVRAEGIDPVMMTEVSRVLHMEYGEQIDIQFFADQKDQVINGTLKQRYVVTLILTKH